MNITISAEEAESLRYDDEVDGFEVVAREDWARRRWTEVERVTFMHPDYPNRFFMFYHETPLNDDGWHEKIDEPIECEEVFPRERTIVEYR